MSIQQIFQSRDNFKQEWPIEFMLSLLSNSWGERPGGMFKEFLQITSLLVKEGLDLILPEIRIFSAVFPWLLFLIELYLLPVFTKHLIS